MSATTHKLIGSTMESLRISRYHATQQYSSGAGNKFNEALPRRNMGSAPLPEIVRTSTVAVPVSAAFRCFNLRNRGKRDNFCAHHAALLFTETVPRRSPITKFRAQMCTITRTCNCSEPLDCRRKKARSPSRSTRTRVNMRRDSIENENIVKQS